VKRTPRVERGLTQEERSVPCVSEKLEILHGSENSLLSRLRLLIYVRTGEALASLVVVRPPDQSLLRLRSPTESHCCGCMTPE
jgi:hypothetical protein